MIERNHNEAMLGSGRVGRNGALLPRRRSALVLAGLGALLLAACGSSADVGDDPATTTTEAVNSSTSSTTTLDADEIDPSLVGSTNGTSVLFPENGNGGYYVSVYDWDLALSDDLTSLSGVATLTASTTQNLQRFSLDARGLQVESVTVDEMPTEFSMVGPELIITTSEPLPAGSEFVVEVVYATEPDDSELGRFRGWFVVPGEQVYALTQAATWTPLDADVDAPPARYIMRFDVPDGFTATAVGTPAVADEAGGVVWDTEREVYFPTFAVADFDTNVIDWDVPVEVSIRNGGPDREQFEAQVLENLPFLESLFGPFPYERLGISVMDRSGEFGYSSPTRIVMPEWMSESRLVHELAHQWAGNAVAVVEEGSNWLIEGLAVYVEALWAESLRDDIDVDATTSRLDGRVPPVTRTLDGVDSTDDIYDETTYDRAALLYHALRLEIGDDAFFVTLREFIQRNLHGTVLVEDLQVVAEEVAEQDLDQFFNAWVSEPEVPALPTSAG